MFVIEFVKILEMLELRKTFPNNNPPDNVISNMKVTTLEKV